MDNIETIIGQLRASLSDPSSVYLNEALAVGNAFRELDKAVASVHANFTGEVSETERLGTELHRFLVATVSQLPLASTIVSIFRSRSTTTPIQPPKKRRGRKPKSQEDVSVTAVASAPEAVKPKRKRRTKAEMAAVRVVATSVVDETVTLEQAGV